MLLLAAAAYKLRFSCWHAFISNAFVVKPLIAMSFTANPCFLLTLWLPGVLWATYGADGIIIFIPCENICNEQQFITNLRVAYHLILTLGHQLFKQCLILLISLFCKPSFLPLFLRTPEIHQKSQRTSKIALQIKPARTSTSGFGVLTDAAEEVST